MSYPCCACCFGRHFGAFRHGAPCSIHQAKEPEFRKQVFLEEMNMQLENYYSRNFGASIVMTNIRDLVSEYARD